MNFARILPVPEIRSALTAVERIGNCIASRRHRRSLNPLYLHGPSGTGKTLLVSTLVEKLTRRVPDIVATVISAAELTSPNQGAGAARSEDDGLLQSARQSDLLVIEDFQRLPSRSVEPVVLLLDDMLARQQQIVLTASLGPRQLSFPTRLTSRLAAGLVISLEPLQASSRLTLLQDKAERRQLAVSREVLAWLAEHLTGGARQLDGALERLQVLSRNHRRTIDIALVAATFREEMDAAKPTVDHIARHVSGYYQVAPSQLQSSQRTRKVLLPRQVGMYLARQLTGLSLGQIGAYFGGRDHSTVLHACRKVEQALERDTAFSGTIRRLRAELK